MAKHAAVTDREPAVVIGLITGVVGAVIALLVAFGVELSKDQITAILGLFAAVAPIAAAVWTRTKVTPSDAVVARISPDPAESRIVAGPASTLTDGTPVTVTKGS